MTPEVRTDPLIVQCRAHLTTNCPVCYDASSYGFNIERRTPVDTIYSILRGIAAVGILVAAALATYLMIVGLLYVAGVIHA